MKKFIKFIVRKSYLIYFLSVLILALVSGGALSLVTAMLDFLGDIGSIIFGVWTAINIVIYCYYEFKNMDKHKSNNI